MEQGQQLSLLCQMAAADSLQQLADMAYTLLGNPVFIADMAHTILAYTKVVNIPHPRWQIDVVQSHLDRNLLRQDREVSSVHLAAEKSRMPVLVTDGDVPFPRIIKVLVSGGRPFGVLVLTSYLQPLGKQDIELVELISTFVVSRLEKGTYFISSHDNAIENFLLQLLGGAPFNGPEVQKRLGILGCSFQTNLYCLSVGSASTSNDAHGNLLPILESFSALPFCRSFLYNSTIVCIFSSDVEILHWDNQAGQLTELLRKNNLVAGVSRRFHSLHTLREFYLQSHEALMLAYALGRPDRYFPYDGFSVYHLLQTLPRGVPAQFCHQKIRELNDYDRQHNTELSITLQVYLEHTRSLSKTAEILFVHRNTVRYRINKCMELLGSDLTDGNETFSYIFSLRILEFERKLEGRVPLGSPHPKSGKEEAE